MYYVLSLIPIMFDYGCIFFEQSNIFALQLSEFASDWFLFTAFLIWINCVYILSRHSSPFGATLMSFFVALMRYGAVYLKYYAQKKTVLDGFAVKAIFLSNFYIFVPFAASAVMFLLYKIFFKKRKRKRIK